MLAPHTPVSLLISGLALGAGPLLNLLLHHFHVYEWFLGPEGQLSGSLLDEPPTHDNIPEVRPPIHLTLLKSPPPQPPTFKRPLVLPDMAVVCADCAGSAG